MKSDIKARDRVLKSVREALLQPSIEPIKDTDFDNPIYHEMTKDELALHFAKEFIAQGGQFVYCESKDEMQIALSQLTKNATAVRCIKNEYCDEINIGNTENLFQNHSVLISTCESLCAYTGSVIVSSALNPRNRDFFATDRLIILAGTKQLFPYLKDCLINMKTKYNGRLPGMISCISGPSATGDIEKTIVTGAHGAREMYCLLLEEY
jgi:L-lactate dehydrogenase complex protein LldG